MPGDDADLIDRACKGEVVGDGSKQIALLVEAARKWKQIADIRKHAIQQIHRQTDRIWMCEYDGDEKRKALLEEAAFESQRDFKYSLYGENIKRRQRKAEREKQKVEAPQ